MPRIRQLPPDIAAKIAAGEVVERPSSVVKELIENSLDAGATRIDVELELGGTELIRVADDGCGIPPGEMLLAFAPHATSKLESADDLFAVRTLGFRGEALSSIAGIAKVSLQSRPPDAAAGAEVVSDGGAFGPVRPWAGRAGTRVEVRHLFFNVPVRKKFLKSIPTELGQACEVITRVALSRPGVQLTLKHNGKLVYDVPAAATLPDRIGLFFGRDIKDALLEVDTGPGPARLTGYVADPKCDRGNAKLQYFFVNGRWFRDRSLGYALQEAYRGLLMTSRYAVAFLGIEVPPHEVDVNVHPTKAEVKFRDPSLLFSLVRGGVKARLLKANLVPQLTAPVTDPGNSPRGPVPVTAPPVPTESVTGRLPGLDTPAYPVGPPDVRGPGSPAIAPLPIVVPPPEIVEPTTPAPPTPTVIQLHDAYLVQETAEGMLVIDQHALHERILFEQIRRRVRDGKLEVQRLLIPEPIDLPPDQYAAVIDAAEELRELGLEVSPFGGNTVLLGSYPTLLARKPPHAVFAAAVDYLVSKDRAPAKEVLLDHLMATMACKAAVKAGDKLTAEEIAHLLHLRAFAEDSHHCPHGRPTSLLFSRQQLDRQFGRI